MIILYRYNINDYPLNELFKKLPRCFGTHEKDRIKKYIKEEDQKRSIIGKIAIVKIISDIFHIDKMKLVFDRDNYDRPFLKNPVISELDFNIAHSGKYVVVAVNDKGKIGVDVEKIKKIDLDIAKDVFLDREIRYMNSNRDLVLENFYKLWSLKESFVKAIGEGLSYPLKNFHFEFEGEKIIHRIKNKKSNWNFSSFDMAGDYKAAICSKNFEINCKAREGYLF